MIGKKDVLGLTDDQGIIDFFINDSDLYFEDLSDQSQETITNSSGLMKLLLQSDECKHEGLFDSYNELEEVLSNNLKNDPDLLLTAIEVRPTLLGAFNASIITPEIYIAALNHPWVDNQDEMDIITSALDCQNINDEFINLFLEWNFPGCSNIFQIVRDASHENLSIESIMCLLNSLIDEISHNTNQINHSNDFLYGGNDHYYHWSYHISFSSFSTFIDINYLLKNSEIISCLKNLKTVLKMHFKKLVSLKKLIFIDQPVAEIKPEEIFKQWLDGLEELINRYE